MKFGIDRLLADPALRGPLKGRRLALLAHPASVTADLTHSLDALAACSDLTLTAAFGPQHGMRGDKQDNMMESPDFNDPVHGIPVFSLYGEVRRPLPEWMDTFDVMLVDLQDLGCRIYTFITTLLYVLEAAAEHGKAVWVLDRPNPLGGVRVSGSPLDPKWKSFVGQVPVPYVHGMTAGELAKMINAYGWIKARPRLSVIPMRGWQRSMIWRDTGLRWIATSPNIPGPESPFYYATNGILGGLNGVDIGIGTSRPFEYAGGPGINPDEFAASLNRRGIPGVRFLPYHSVRKPGFAGAQLLIDPRGNTDLLALAVVLSSEVCRRTGNSPLRATNGDSRTLFHKVYGSDSLFRDLQSGRPVGSIIASWQPSLNSFRSARQGFLMYG